MFGRGGCWLTRSNGLVLSGSVGTGLKRLGSIELGCMAARLLRGTACIIGLVGGGAGGVWEVSTGLGVPIWFTVSASRSRDTNSGSCTLICGEATLSSMFLRRESAAATAGSKGGACRDSVGRTEMVGPTDDGREDGRELGRELGCASLDAEGGGEGLKRSTKLGAGLLHDDGDFV